MKKKNYKEGITKEQQSIKNIILSNKWEGKLWNWEHSILEFLCKLILVFEA